MQEKLSETYIEIIDYTGNKIKLYEYTVKHISMRHPEITDIAGFVENILKHPILVTEDESPNTVIYHHSVKKPIVHVAYIEVEKSIVKSAHISDKIKGGNVIWIGAKNLDI